MTKRSQPKILKRVGEILKYKYKMPNKLISTYIQSKSIPNIKERCDIIHAVINLEKQYNWFDKIDLRYFLKVLLENGIVCISKEAYSQYKRNNVLWKSDIPKHFNDKEALKCILTQRKQTKNIKTRVNRSNVSWEHVVPTKVLVDKLLELDKSGTLSDKKIEEMIEKYGYVCLVTKDENRKLDKNKFREKMPQGWKYGDDAFARYKAVGIEIQK